MTEPNPVVDRVPGRTLILLRHSKAEQDVGLADIERPLTARGQADAVAAGAWLARHGDRPDQVICSTARRARQTWEGVSATVAGVPAAYEPTVGFEPDVYQGTAWDLFDLLRQVSPEVASVLLVGHNPTISELSALLDPPHREPGGLRTSGIVVHRLDGDWDDLRPGSAPVLRRHTARAE